MAKRTKGVVKETDVANGVRGDGEGDRGGSEGEVKGTDGPWVGC